MTGEGAPAVEDRSSKSSPGARFELPGTRHQLTVLGRRTGAFDAADSEEYPQMIKAFTVALALTFAAPLAMSTAAFAEDSMRRDGVDTHNGSDMHKDAKMESDRHGDARRHGAMHTRDRDAHDREEARVTSELNQRELGGNREMRDR
jgi:pentapeptide MXKDX repeat protein